MTIYFRFCVCAVCVCIFSYMYCPCYFVFVFVSCLYVVFTSVLEESQGLTIYAFVMLLLAMISLHMLTFRLMVTMVAEFCSLVILIHNTLLGEITISSTRTTRVNKILYLYSPVRNDTFPHAKIQLH